MRVALVVALLAVAAVAPPAAAGGNEAPMAEAGLDQQVTADTTVVLDAGGSYDPDGGIASYDWSIRTPDGRTVTPADPGAVRTTFVPDRTGRYVVTLTVTDDDGGTATDTAYVEVDPGGSGDADGDRSDAGDESSPDGSANGDGSGSEAGPGGDGNGSVDSGGDTGDESSGGSVEDGSDDGEGSDDGSDGGEGSDGGTGSPDPSDRNRSEDGAGPGEGPSGNGTDAGPGGPAGPEEGNETDDLPGDPTGDSTDDPNRTTGGGAGNAPPWATIDGPASLAPGERARYTVAAGDFDGLVRSVEWGAGGGGTSVVRTAPSDGPLTVSATVTDDDGGRTVVTRTVRVVPGDGNEPPTVELSTPGPVLVGGDLRWSVAASDPDGEVVDLSFAPAREFDLAGPRTYTVRVTATDDDGATATDTLRVAPVPWRSDALSDLPGWVAGRPADPF